MAGRAAMISELRVSIEDSAVEAVIDGRRESGRLDSFLDEWGDATDDPGCAAFIIVEWDTGGWSPIECQFDPVIATVH